MEFARAQPWSQWWHEIAQRAAPADAIDLAPRTLWLVLAAVLVLVAVSPLWRVVGVVVTLVHELGHALVARLAGRRFHGFVLRADMSGHAITSGRPRGLGLILTTAAGYPAPAITGALLARAAIHGWSAPVLTGIGIGLLVFALVRVRSLYTAATVITTIAATAALWWWRDDARQAIVLIAAGVLLIAGAWRHLGALRSPREKGSDPDVLARLTRIPAAVWIAGFALAAGWATWDVVQMLAPVTR